MKQEIKSLKDIYQSKLPSNQQYFIKSDLNSAGFPAFLSERMEQIAIEHLTGDVPFPKTNWASDNSIQIREKWLAFFATLETQVHIPTSDLGSVLTQALSDIINIFTNPRGFLPDYIFGNDSQLSATEVLKRCQMIVIYRHFPIFLEKYIQKKKADTITKEQFSNIVHALDSRLSSSYGTLDWATVIKPALVLYNDAVPATIFTELFHHKDMHGTAMKFERSSGTVSHDSFIEIFSQPEPELSETSITEPVQPLDTSDSISDKTKSTHELATSEESTAMQELKTTSDSDIEEDEVLEDDGYPDEIKVVKEPVDTQLSSEEHQETHKEADFDADITEVTEHSAKKDNTSDIGETLLQKLQDGTNVEENTTPEASEEEHPENESTEEVEAEKDDQDDENEEPIYAMFGKHEKENRLEREAAEEKNEEDVPMWKTFTRDSEDVIPFSEDKEKDKDKDKPFMRIKMFEPPVPENAGAQLMEHLSDGRKAYVTELFNGDDSAYEYSIDQLANFRNWREAGKYLTNEIFKRNTIDMYSDTAVDFTDKLHKFFIDRDRQK